MEGVMAEMVVLMELLLALVVGVEVVPVVMGR